ncbi:leucine-rich repeat protein [Butyrivibrio sp. VCD2006]|uniref:leucine-rich repeat protein n=1 Tax=Butyrivibrio sp. VCD2006 TaxID=1280664 RepID=UPI000686DCAD|nr:leucine-rich repeat protein [Butyrivibrio sp. VCD2006]
MKKVFGKLFCIIASFVCMIALFGGSSISSKAAAIQPAKNVAITQNAMEYTPVSDGYYTAIVTCKDADTGVEKIVCTDKNFQGYAGRPVSMAGSNFQVCFNQLGTYTLYVIGSAEKLNKSYKTIQEYENDPNLAIASHSHVLTNRMPKPQDVTMKEVTRDGEQYIKFTWKYDGYTHLVLSSKGGIGIYGSDTLQCYIKASNARGRTYEVRTESNNYATVANSEPIQFEIPEEKKVIDPNYPFENVKFTSGGISFKTLLPGYSTAMATRRNSEGRDIPFYLNRVEYYDKEHGSSITSTAIDDAYRNTGLMTLYVMWSAEPFDFSLNIADYEANSKIKIAKVQANITERMDQPENVKVERVEREGTDYYKISWDRDGCTHLVEYDYGSSHGSYDYTYIEYRESITYFKVYAMSNDFSQYAHSLPVKIDAATGAIIPPEDPGPTRPENPEDPTDPAHPTDPDVPSEPTDPTQPGDPTDPSQPSNPTDPSQPGNPTDPTQPDNPGQGGSSEQGDTPGANTNPEQGGGSASGQGGSSGQDSPSDQTTAPTVGNSAEAALPATVTANGVTYSIGVDGNATATKIGNVKKVSINTVSHNGINYPVTKIAAGAAKNNKNLTAVKIGKNVKSIGKKAFYNCKKLKKVTIKAGKSLKVGKGAFKKISDDAKISVKGLKGKAKRKIFSAIGSK